MDGAGENVPRLELVLPAHLLRCEPVAGEKAQADTGKGEPVLGKDSEESQAVQTLGLAGFRSGNQRRRIK